jgi:serine/threonine protein kinase
MVGQTVSHFRIEGELGRGGMGVVYRATDTLLGREVDFRPLRPDPRFQDLLRRVGLPPD